MTKPFAGFSFRGFWNDSKYARESYIERAPTPALVASIEEALGYKLPASYVWLMRRHNGGIPARSCYPTKKRTSWADDHVAVHGISSIGRKKAHSLCGALGSEFMLDEWGYPRIGVVFADCPSAGGHFSLHADPLSHFMYDVELWLYAISHPTFTRETFLADYEKILCFDGDFSTGGYAPEFVTDWFDARIDDRTILRTKKGLTLSPKAAAHVVKKLKKLVSS